MTRRAWAGILAVAALAAAMGEALAFAPIPKASARALGVTRGKRFSSGLVFVNGKYLPPPYQVERWGTGLRINGQSVTGEVISWAEFVKTQAGAKVTRNAAPSPVVPATPAAEQSEEEASLDDLFDDTPKDKKTGKRKAPRTAAAEPSVSYSFDGEFQPNAQTKALVKRINAARTKVDQTLRAGGFICFGNGYSRVTGDAGTAYALLKKLPDAQQKSESAAELAATLRNAGLVFLTDAICRDLYRNRIDYRALSSRRDSWQQERQVERLLRGQP